MFSKEFLNSLDEPAALPTPKNEREPLFVPTAEPAKRDIVKPLAAIVGAMVLVAGLAIAGHELSQSPRVEPTAPVAKAEPKAEPVYTQAKAETIQQVVPLPPPVPKPEPKDEPIPPRVVDDPKPEPVETPEEFEKRIRAAVIKEREARLAPVEDAEMEKDAAAVDNELAAKAKEEPRPDSRPVLTWIAGAKSKAPATMLEALSGFRHEEVEKDGTSYDKYGPRVKFKGADGLDYFIRATTFSDKTATKIKVKFGQAKHSDKFPQVDFAVNYRNRNLPDGGGCCVWAAGSNMAQYHGYTFRLEDHRYGGAGPHSLYRVLARESIPSVWTPAGRNSVQLLRDAVDNGLPAAIGLGGQHYVNVVGVSQTEVAIVDNNGPLNVRRVPMERFRQIWDGSCNIVTPPKKSEAFLAKYRSNRWGQVDPSAPRDLSDEAPSQFPETTGSYPAPPRMDVNCSPSRAAFLRSQGIHVLEPGPEGPPVYNPYRQ